VCFRPILDCSVTSVALLSALIVAKGFRCDRAYPGAVTGPPHRDITTLIARSWINVPQAINPEAIVLGSAGVLLNINGHARLVFLSQIFPRRSQGFDCLQPLIDDNAL